MGQPYSDEAWQRLMATALEETGLPRRELLDHIGREFLADAQKRWSPWFKMAGNSLDFLRIQPLIHSSFASGTVSAEERARIEDKFKILSQTDRSLKVRYRSENQLCDLYLSLAQVFVESYGDEVEITKTACTRAGDEACLIELNFVKLSRPSNPDLLRNSWTPFAPV